MITRQAIADDLRAHANLQTRYRLRSTVGTFCAVGRICDLVNPHAWVEPIDEDGLFGWVDTYGEIHHAVPPKLSLAEQTELSADEIDTLSELNDMGSGFVELAEVIEQGRLVRDFDADDNGR